MSACFSCFSLLSFFIQAILRANAPADTSRVTLRFPFHWNCRLLWLEPVFDGLLECVNGLESLGASLGVLLGSGPILGLI